ncbi:MAG: O-antigen ligase family protein [Thermoleophilia bacterium]|nr:O-antigen ligase family protein [Thermoleophilia bacterium]
MSDRLPRIALVVLIVGLAVHNLVMAELWDIGVRGASLDALAAWKDVLLAAALVVALLAADRLPSWLWADRLALLYTALVLLYWLVPQGWLGDGVATQKGQLLAARHDLIPVAAYFLGRLLVLTPATWRRLSLALVGVAISVTAWGLADVYLVPLQWWRDSGVPGWFGEQLGLDYSEGLSGLPENWVLNTGDELNPIRRLGSTFLSPLATAYVLVIVLLYLVARRRPWWVALVGGVAYAGLLWTHTRAAFLALALGLVVLAIAQRRLLPLGLAVASLVISVGFVKAFPTIGPSTSYTQSELEILRQGGQQNPGVDSDPLAGGDSSTTSHWRNLRDGVRTVVRHPQGYGLGNAGVNASRTGVEIKAGESTYTEIGVNTGIVGLVAFIAWLFAVLAGLWRRSAWLSAAWVAMLAIGVQTDVIGVHWVAYVLFALAGVAIGGGLPDDAEESPA